MIDPEDKQIGPKVFYRTFSLPTDTISGIVLKHKSLRTDRPCSMVLNFDTQVMRRSSPATPKFTVLRLLPLTIEEKVRCRCGLEGYVTDGRWEPDA